MAGVEGIAQAGPSVAPQRRRRALTTADLQEFLDQLVALDAEVSDAERVDQLGLLESIKGAAAAAQARVTVAFYGSQRGAQAAARVPARERGRGVAAQVALARRDSPARGSGHLGLARALTRELPHTMAHLTAGRITEWRATLVCRETAALDVEHRSEVDALDPAAMARRSGRAESERRVSLRPAPDTMTYLTALLPVAQGVAVDAALTAAAGQAGGDGDPRGRGQVMADTLVERVTGQQSAAAVPVEVQLVMPAGTLLGVGSEPVLVPGHGALPASFARDLLARCARAGAPLWLRRLFTAPDGRDLVSMESRRRRFDGSLRELIELRDETWRTPWCDARIRHGDHVIPHRVGGATCAANGQGLCEACNHAKEAPGWHARTTGPGPSPGRPHAPPHTVRTTTPTGRTYDSTAPPILPTRMPPDPPRTSAPPDPPSRAQLRRSGGAGASALERHLQRQLEAA